MTMDRMLILVTCDNAIYKVVSELTQLMVITNSIKHNTLNESQTEYLELQFITVLLSYVDHGFISYNIYKATV